VNIWTRVWSLILARPVWQYRLLMFTNTESLFKKHNLTFRMGQKIKLQTLFSSSPNTDGFYTFYISQGSVVTQLRCGGMFSNHFATNFSQNAAVKKFWKSINIWQRYVQNFVAYFLGHPVYFKKTMHTFTDLEQLWSIYHVNKTIKTLTWPVTRQNIIENVWERLKR